MGWFGFGFMPLQKNWVIRNILSVFSLFFLFRGKGPRSFGAKIIAHFFSRASMLRDPATADFVSRWPKVPYRYSAPRIGSRVARRFYQCAATPRKGPGCSGAMYVRASQMVTTPQVSLGIPDCIFYCNCACLRFTVCAQRQNHVESSNAARA